MHLQACVMNANSQSTSSRQWVVVPEHGQTDVSDLVLDNAVVRGRRDAGTWVLPYTLSKQ